MADPRMSSQKILAATFKVPLVKVRGPRCAGSRCGSLAPCYQCCSCGLPGPTRTLARCLPSQSFVVCGWHSKCFLRLTCAFREISSHDSCLKSGQPGSLQRTFLPKTRKPGSQFHFPLPSITCLLGPSFRRAPPWCTCCRGASRSIHPGLLRTQIGRGGNPLGFIQINQKAARPKCPGLSLQSFSRNSKPPAQLSS
jgi:hypothetical protein